VRREVLEDSRHDQEILSVMRDQQVIERMRNRPLQPIFIGDDLNAYGDE
jgi:hypothetical protein